MGPFPPSQKFLRLCERACIPPSSREGKERQHFLNMKAGGKKRTAALVGSSAMLRHCPAMQKNLPPGYRPGAPPRLPAPDLPRLSPHHSAPGRSLGCACQRPGLLLTLLGLSHGVMSRAASFSRTSQGMTFLCPEHWRPQLLAATSGWTEPSSPKNRWFSRLSH